MSFLTRSMKEIDSEGDRDKLQFYELVLSQEEKAWLDSSYAKICCRVDSEQELLDLVEKAKAAGLTVHLVQDAGKTEFNGVPTYTCAAIGPHSLEKFEGITSHLKLY